MTLRLITEPTVEPVTLAEMRLQIGITTASDTGRDSVITQKIKSARRWCELHTRIAFVTQTWVQYADCFQDYFDLKANLKTVSSVKYIDSNGVLQTLADSEYTVDLVNSRLYPAYDKAWPDARKQVNSVLIEHVSGFGLAVAVPEEIKDAIKFIVGHWENYQSSVEGGERVSTIPYAVTQLLQYHVDLRNCF